ncbi:acetate--CoA ligase [Paraburkholderia aromaticivorans]|uniref:Acetyl-coenzyme A synthetase n=1 Tax=Paraburkholderia aromaticivorans TaxID=2026199 RepID=A0A248VJ75_9BURK|nr:acetate--CoA ligase [Paraburkholderia aromaticivorans]ASV99038.1 acetate--CoA ligase [Paraburkholderia aromaticivorans]
MSTIDTAPPDSTALQIPLARNASIDGMDAYRALVTEANQDYEAFWARLAREHLAWHRPFTKVLNDTDAPFYHWFEDGELNASYNCLDRNLINGLAEKTAIVFESDDGKLTHVTYQALYHRVCRLANALRARGVKKGDRVVIYMPMSVEGVVAMLACARIGAPHSVVFGGFSAKSLHERIVDIGACAVITADEQVRAGKTLPLKTIVDEALAMGGAAGIKTVAIYRRTGGQIPWINERDKWLHELEAAQPDTCEPEWVGAEHPLFVLYTSGSTGTPKGVQHSTGGYLLWAAATMKWTFDIKPEDVFWCTADIGWITGHTYICYGPTAVGATQVIFEGVPTYPNAGRFWEMIQRHKVSIFYTAPTAIRSLIKSADANHAVHPDSFDLSSLRLLGTVGEPINPSAWTWYARHVGGGRCPVLDTFWQTETGGHMISPLPGVTPLVPGSCTLPMPGIDAAIVDETGEEVPNGNGGVLVIRKPWPSMIRTIWGNPERFRQGYFPGELGGKLYLAGDGAIRDRDTGYFTITGRIDDVLNVSGHRLGTMEIESALAAHPLVAEAAVVGRPDETAGEAIVAFVVLKAERPSGADAKRVADELRAWVGKEIGPIAKPKDIRFGDAMPKTRSGKVVRRLLRSVAKGEVISQDTSTVENPAVISQFADAA